MGSTAKDIAEALFSRTQQAVLGLLFGSAARGALAPESDIDLLVEFEAGKAPSFWAEPEMREAFSALFGGRRVDLVPPEVLENPYRRKSILRDLKVLYEA